MKSSIDFRIGNWQVGSIGNTAGVFVGNNLQYGWRMSSKQNQASRNITGDHNWIQDAVNEVLDPDGIDTWVQKTPPGASTVPPSLALAPAQTGRQWRRLPDWLSDWAD